MSEQGRRLARRVELRVAKGEYGLTVDGVEFPWLVAADPAPQPGPVAGDRMPTLTLTLLAERIDVLHSVGKDVD